jgi:hypothetical protein
LRARQRKGWPLFRFLSNPAHTSNLKGKIMHKLIEAFRKVPSPTNRAKLQAYLNKHMMAVCLATPEELAFLKTHEFKI